MKPPFAAFAVPAAAALLVIAAITALFLAFTPAHGAAVGAAGPPTLAEARDLLRDQEWERASDAFALFLAGNPWHGGAWSGLADARYQMQEWGPAEEAYRKAFDLGVWPANAAYNAACCAARAGRPDDSLDWLEKSIAVGFSDIDYLLADSDLATVRTRLRFRSLVGMRVSENVTRDEGWQQDLRSLVQQIETRHWSPYHAVSREDLEAAAARLDARIPELADHEIVVELRRIVASIGDGHTNLSFPGSRHPEHGVAEPESRIAGFHRYPCRIYRYADGWFVRAASPENARIVGKRITAINGTSIEDVYAAVALLVSGDNEWTRLSNAPGSMVCPEVLDALGVIGGVGEAGFLLEGAGGPERIVLRPEPWVTDTSEWPSLEAGAPGTPPYLRNPGDWHWFEPLPDGTLYVKFAVVRNQEGDETVEEFAERLFAWIDENDPPRVAFDLRDNSGGNNFLNPAIVHGFLRSRVNEPGRLFTIIGRRTFSAAMCLAANLDRETETLFVGEPTGSSPNFIGETSVTHLPWSGLRLSVSTLYWQNSYAQDRRIWIAPDLAAQISSADVRAGRDPALAAIAAYTQPRP